MLNPVIARTRRSFLALPAVIAPGFTVVEASAQTDPLPSWNNGSAKAAIASFVQMACRRHNEHWRTIFKTWSHMQPPAAMRQ